MASVAVGGRVVAGSGGRRPLVAVILAGIVGMVKKKHRVRVKDHPGIATRVVLFIRDMAGSVAAFTALTIGLWQLTPVAGWCTLGVSLLLLDFQRATRAGGRP